MIRNISIAMSCLFLGACAVGNKHEYSGPAPDVTVPSGNSIAVGVQDQRSYVTGGNKTETFVGLSRGGFGNTFDVTTASGKPLADDFRTTIAQVFKRNGVSVKEIAIRPTESGSEARQALVKLGQARSLLLTLTEWKSDTYMVTLLHYDIRLAVFDSAGKVLGEQSLQGTDSLGSSAINPPGHAREAIPPAYKKKLEQLLTSAEIQQALR
jgi:hypothetical protein